MQTKGGPRGRSAIMMFLEWLASGAGWRTAIGVN